MKLRLLLSSSIVALSLLSANAQSRGIDNPVTKAVLDAYQVMLRQNPDDYMTWFRRANEYYRHDEYLKALKDINEALQRTPVSDTDLRYQEYMLRAGIYNQTGRKIEAIADLNEACRLDPESYAAVYQRANTEYELENFAEAKNDYLRLQRMNARSSEAPLGLARIAIKENNLGMANDYLEQAVSLDPNNPETYVRRSSVRKLMGNHNGAVDDLILALSINSDHAKAIEALVDYGNTNYAATITGISEAIRQAPQVGMFWYLRAVIAQAHYRYSAAIADYRHIIDNGLYKYQGLYASIAECEYALGEFDSALSNIGYALGMSANEAQNFSLKAKILRALGRYDEAVEAAARALSVDRNYADGLVEMGLCYMAKENYKEASALFGEAIMTDAENPYYYMLRAWLMLEYMNQSDAAMGFYEQVNEMDFFYIDNIRSLKGFALLFLDQVTRAEGWMNNIVTTVTDNDGLVNYYAACFYCAAGDYDRALSCAETSMKAGYGNIYNWMYNNDARINVAPLRDDLRFLNLLHRYEGVFK